MDCQGHALRTGIRPGSLSVEVACHYLGRCGVYRVMDASDAAVIQQLYPEARAFAAVVADRDDDPDDLLHDALLALLRRGSLAQLEHPLAYVRRAVPNLASNRRRSLARRWTALGRLKYSSSTDDHYPSDLSDLLRLSPKLRAVLWLVDVEGQSFAAAATILDCSESAARSRASRGRKELLALLQSEHVELENEGLGHHG